jgi:GT2 family glycosyltransferase
VHPVEVTIIIVNWNGGELLRRCLASIRLNVDLTRAQVLVVDNNSGDGSREAAEREFPEMRIINSGGNIGFGKANNLVRPHVSTPLVMFLNPDTEVLPGSLPAMVSFLDSHPEVGALGCKLRESDGSPHELPLQWSPSPWTQFLHVTLTTNRMSSTVRKLLPYADPRRSSYVTKLCGGCILARKTALDSVGWFDERYFMYAEDIDLCHSLLHKGWKLYYLSEAEMFHAGGGTSRKTKKEFPILMMCESISKMMCKYHGKVGGFVYRLAILAGCHLRLLALVLLRSLAAISPIGRQANYSDSWFKYRTMILWCLRLRKPIIPDRSARNA